MLGTIPEPGDLSMSDLAARLTNKEQLDLVRLTALNVDPAAASTRNLATFVDEQNQLGALSICAKGGASSGTKILSTTAFVSNTKTEIDVYRLPAAG
jgi:hypothetical protein